MGWDGMGWLAKWLITLHYMLLPTPCSLHILNYSCHATRAVGAFRWIFGIFVFVYKIWQPKGQVQCCEVFLGWWSSSQTSNRAWLNQHIFHQNKCNMAANLHLHSFSFYFLLDRPMVLVHACSINVMTISSIHAYQNKYIIFPMFRAHNSRATIM